MKPKTRIRNDDERAVSPVIGVILMVAITVILAAVIGTFVLDLGQSAGQTAPQASHSVDASTSANNVTISHTGGDGMSDDSTRIMITNESTGETQTYEPGESNDVWTVGNDVEVSTISGSLNGSDVFTDRTSGGGVTSTQFNILGGTQYTITIIDTASQRQIFETTVTA